MQKEQSLIFHNGSKHHLTIKEMTEESERQFECLRENTEKCRTSSVPIKK